MEKDSIKDNFVDDCQFLGGKVMYRVIICDDDGSILEKVRLRIVSFFEMSNTRVKVHCYDSPEQISDQILTSCDLALLDIDYTNSKINGIDLARKIRQKRKDTVIIFITNYIEYAPEGYEVQAFRYVLKHDINTELQPYLSQALEQLSSAKNSFKIQVNGEIIDLPIEDIIYFEVLQHHVTAYLQRKDKNIKPYRFIGSLSDLEDQLEQHGFLRIHKSYLVNMRFIKTFKCREATMKNDTVLRVSEKSYAENKKKYLLWKGWQ